MMKLFVAACTILCVASDSPYLQLVMNSVENQISDARLKILARALPGIVSANVPDEFKTFADTGKEFLKQASFTQVYADKVDTIKVYFPKFPAADVEKAQKLLETYKDSSKVTGVLKALLPSVLDCGACTFGSISSGIENAVDPPAPEPVTPGYDLGLKIVVTGASKKIDSVVWAVATGNMPGALEKGFSTAVAAGVGIPEETKDLVIQFLKSVELKQELDGNILTLSASFPGVDQSYVEMYMPMFKKYVSDNRALTYSIKKNSRNIY
jgi:hypothetical protein